MDAYEHPRRGGLVEAGDEFLAAPALQAFLEHACSVGRAVSRSPSKTRPLRGDAFGYHVPGVDREVRRWIASGGMLHHDLVTPRPEHWGRTFDHPLTLDVVVVRRVLGDDLIGVFGFATLPPTRIRRSHATCRPWIPVAIAVRVEPHIEDRMGAGGDRHVH